MHDNRKGHTMTNLATLLDWAAENAPDDIREIVLACFATRGRRRGYLLRSVPTRKGDAVVGAWRALWECVDIRRAAPFAAIFASDEERRAHAAVDAWIASPACEVMGETVSVATLVAIAGDTGFTRWRLDSRESARAAIADACGLDRESVGASWRTNV
jgi:hypothetical protein